MRAFQLHDYETPPTLCDVPHPVAAAGEVVIKVAACGLNFGDLLMMTGRYQERPPLPATLGMEISGTVADVGDDVHHLFVGQRVIGFCGHGGLADYCALAADHCAQLDDTMDDITAAAFQVTYGTSHLALTKRAHIAKGETLLVTGAAGGVGLTAIELGAKLGATVIAAARGTQKLEICKAAGAHHVIDTDTDDITARVKALGGADVIYETIGGDVFTSALKACNRGGRILVIGFAGGTVPPVAVNHLLVKNINLIGFYWGGYLSTNPRVLHESLHDLMRWHAAGNLKPHVSHTLPIEQVTQAFELLRARESTGKIVITL